MPLCIQWSMNTYCCSPLEGWSWEESVPPASDCRLRFRGEDVRRNSLYRDQRHHCYARPDKEYV